MTLLVYFTTKDFIHAHIHTRTTTRVLTFVYSYRYVHTNTLCTYVYVDIYLYKNGCDRRRSWVFVLEGLSLYVSNMDLEPEMKGDFPFPKELI